RQDRQACGSAGLSFGRAADGLSLVDVHAVDGMHQAIIGGNAYLFVESEPNTGNRVLSISAETNGKRATISLGTTFGEFGAFASSARSPRGPTRVEARIAHPTIGLPARGAKRGFSRDRLELTPFERAR